MRGRTTKNINSETMRKVWTPWGERVSKGTIAAVTGISKASVTRIVDIMTLAKAHEVDKLREYCRGAYVAQKKTACNFFGYEFEKTPRVIYHNDDYKAVEIVPATFEQLTTDDIPEEATPKFTPFESAVLASLSAINARLAQICAELGVKE